MIVMECPVFSACFPANQLTFRETVVNTHSVRGEGSLSEPSRRGTAPLAGFATIHLSSQERVMPIDRLQTRINEQIRISPVRVIGEDGQQLGILPTQEAISRAFEADLDLVEVAPNERPPVCRIMDYGKYKYEKKKKTGQNQHHTKTKEIRLRPKTGEHDVSFKVKQALGFLKHKDKVQVSVVFRGREMAHVEEGRRVMEEVIELLAEFGKVEITPQQHGRRMICTIAPR